MFKEDHQSQFVKSFFEEEADVSDDASDNDSDVDEFGRALTYESAETKTMADLIYTRSPGDVARMLLNEKNAEVKQTIRNAALRQLDIICNMKTPLYEIHAITDDDMSTLILKIFLTAEPDVYAFYIEDDFSDMEDLEAIMEEHDITNASRISDAIERVNEVRDSRPEMNRTPYDISMALDYIPEEGESQRFTIQSIMESLFTYDSDDSERSGDDVEIERIVAHEENEGQTMYLVRWKGFDSSHDEWLSIAQLASAQSIVDEYRSEHADDFFPSQPPDDQSDKRLKRRAQLRRNFMIIDSDNE